MLATRRTMESRFSPRAKAIVLWGTLVLALVFLSRVPHVLSPFIWAVVTAYIFQPVITGLTRLTRLPRRLVAVALYFLLVWALVLAVVTALPLLRAQAIELVNQAPSTIHFANQEFTQRFPAIAARFDLDTAALDRQLRDLTNQWTLAAPRRAIAFLQGLLAFLLEFFVYLIATFYLLTQGDRIVANARRLVPARYHREFDRLLGEINTTLGGYLRGQLLLVAIMSSVTYVALVIYGIRYAAILALATGLLELIPILGPWTAGTIAVSVAALQPVTPFGWSHLTLAVVVGITYFVLRQLEDNLVIPVVIGRIIHLHPLVMIFILLVGTAIGGVLGLFLAVPLGAVVKILLRYVYEKMVADDERQVVLVEQRATVEELGRELAARENQRIVLVIQPGVLAWDDLPLLHQLATERTRFGVELSVVTQDTIAASLATAVGLPTTVIPASTTGTGQPEATLAV